MVYITTRVDLQTALALHKKRPATDELIELENYLKDLGVALKPIHPNVDDVELMRYFVIAVDNLTRAEKIRTLLGQCKAIEAAYIKPPEKPASKRAGSNKE